MNILYTPSFSRQKPIANFASFHLSYTKRDNNISKSCDHTPNASLSYKKSHLKVQAIFPIYAYSFHAKRLELFSQGSEFYSGRLGNKIPKAWNFSPKHSRIFGTPI